MRVQQLLLIGIAVFGLIGLFHFLGSRARKVRTERLAQVAQKLGIPFFPTGYSVLNERLHSLALLLKLQGRLTIFSLSIPGPGSIVNVLCEVRSEVEFAFFDYTYLAGSGDDVTTKTQSVMYFRSKLLDLPKFAVFPKMWFVTGSGFFDQAIELGMYPQFSKQHGLVSDDSAAVRKLFRDELIEFFVGQKNKLCVHGYDHELLFWRLGERTKPDQVMQFIEDGFEIFKRLRHSTGA